MHIINSILSWWMKKRMHQIELFVKYPHEVQEDWRVRLLQTAKTTEWGKKYDYATIRSLKNFKERVPVSNYDAFKPYISRVMHGEQNS